MEEFRAAQRLPLAEWETQERDPDTTEEGHKIRKLHLQQVEEVKAALHASKAAQASITTAVGFNIRDLPEADGGSGYAAWVTPSGAVEPREDLWRHLPESSGIYSGTERLGEDGECEEVDIGFAYNEESEPEEHPQEGEVVKEARSVVGKLLEKDNRDP